MSGDRPTDAEPGVDETQGDRNDSRFDVARRDYLKAMGMAGAATLGTAATDTAAASVADADVVPVGSGSYTTAMPDDSNLDFSNSDASGYAAPPDPDYVYTTENATGPIPSNSWWSTIPFGLPKWYDEDGDPLGQGAVVGLPWIANTSQRGLTIQAPDDWDRNPADAEFVKMDYLNAPKLTVGHTANSSFADTRADDWGDWHARAMWGEGTGTTMTTTFVKGSPLLFFEYEGGGAELAFEIKDSTGGNQMLADDSNVTVWEDRGNVLGVTVDGITADNYSHHYGIYAPDGATFDGVGTAELSSDLGGGDYLTVAVLPDASSSTLADFEQYAYNVVRDTYADYDYVQTDANGQPVSEVRTTFEYDIERKPESSASGTLSGLFPHQWKHTDDALTGYQYWSPRGDLRVHAGPSFQTTLNYPGILPFMPDEGSYDRNQLATFVENQMDEDPWKQGSGTDIDTYFIGKDFDHHLRTLPIAQQLGNDDAGVRALNELEDRVSAWLTVQDTSFDTAHEEELFYYRSSIGALVGYPNGFGSAAALNDHHFHYGYFVRAAAEIARNDSQWVDEYGDMVDLLVREYANWERPSGTPTDTTPRDSPKDAFPRFRCFDPYSGHSWAGGDGAAADGTNQESSSEAVNAYAAMIRWGEYTGNTELRDAGVYLYTHEVHAIWDYWFDNANDSQPDTWGDNVDKPINGGPEYNYATMVWSTGYDANIFWGPTDTVENYGINWLPIGGHSLYLGWDEAYAEANWQDMIDARAAAIDAGTTDHLASASAPDADFMPGWKTCAWAYRAFSDSQDAVDLMEAELPMAEASHKSSYVYHYVHNLNALGSVDTSVTADAAMYAVFDDGGAKTYVAYNPDSSSRTVTFSDGTTLDVPANALKTSNGDVTEGWSDGTAPGDGSGDDTTAPTAPTNLSSSGVTTSSFDLSWDAASDSDTGVDHYDVYVDGAVDQSVSGTSATVSGLAADTSYDASVTAVDGAGNESNASGTVTVTTEAESSGQAPYGGSPVELPGTVQAQDYDTGGSGVAYSDSTAGNTGGEYRSEDVDVEVTGDTSGAYNVGWITDGEWLEYTVDAASAGQYDVTARVASADGGGDVSIDVDGTQQASATFAGTGAWQSWTTVSLGTVSLDAGTQVVRVTADTGGFNLNWLAFEANDADTTAPSTPTGLTSTGTTTSSIDLSWDASSDSGTGVDHYDVYVDGAIDQSVSGTSATVSGLDADTSYDLQVSAVDGAGNESALSGVVPVATDAASPDQSAYNGPHAVPGTVQAEDFDTGGQGVAYSDTTSGNDGNASYRDADVDIEGATEGGYNVCWSVDGEWLEYTVQVESAGDYDVTARVASASGGGSFDLSVDGSQVASTSFGATGGWQSWTTVDVGTVSLSAGEHVVRVDMTASDWNLNWLEFVQTSSGTSYSGTSGDGWSATVTQVDTDLYEWSFEPASTASWADVQFADPGTDAWVGYRLDDSDGDNVHVYTRDASSDGSAIDFRFVYDDGNTGQYVSDRKNHTY